MIEKEMAYRGSKSEYFIDPVKEQRVDGSWHFLFIRKCLRCTLMGFERNYQVKIPSKQINTLRLYSNSATHKPFAVEKSNLNPWFVTGFSDAEGSFSVLIQHNSRYISNWRVKIIFAIGLHKKDIELLDKIRFYLGVGKLHIHGIDSIQYRVESIKDIEIIIKFFDNYPLISTKITNYVLLKKAFYMIKLKKHLDEKGVLELVAIKSCLNLGLNPELKQAFPNWNKYKLTEPEYIFTGIPDPYWVAGFSSGDGSFNIKVSNNSTNVFGNRVQLRFAIGLNIMEKQLIISIANYFNLINKNSLTKQNNNNKISYVYYKKNSVILEITKFSNIFNIIIPFFNSYPIQGIKSSDLVDFKIVARMIENKEHLTPEGFNKILEIKDSMNKNRI